MTITSNISAVNVTSTIVPDIIVAKDGSGDYTTIMAGINAAIPGNVISVKNGLYPEKVIGNKSLQIYGQSKQNTIIDGTNIPPKDSLYSDWEYGIVELRANNISFRNIKVQNGKMAGVVSVNASNLYIENIITKNTTGSGIQCHNGNNIKVRHNELDKPNQTPTGYKHQEQLSFSGYGSGIDGFEIAYNYVHDGLIDIAIDMKQGCNNGTCHHNYMTRGGTGGNIYVDPWDKYCKNIDIYKNLVENNTNGKSMGMAPEMGGIIDNIIFRDNILYNCNEGWFSAWSNKSGFVGTVSNVTAQNNVIYKNKYGILFKGYPTHPNPDYSNILIKENIVCNNTDFQIYIRPDIPTSAYSLINNHTNTDYITQSQFDTMRNSLYNEIFV